MSAFVVDKAHINAMIDAGLRTRYQPMRWYTKGKEMSSSLTEANASEVGQMLLEECIKSVAYRYEGSDIPDLPGRSDAEYIIPFQYKHFANPPTPVEILKIISCYEYQSCEHPGWKGSEAYAYCQVLRHSTIVLLPGYDEAPWGWEKWPRKH